LSAAESCALPNYLGSIEKGKDADMHPLSTRGGPKKCSKPGVVSAAVKQVRRASTAHPLRLFIDLC